MHNEPDIGTVYPHAKGDGGDDDDRLAGAETGGSGTLMRGVKPRVKSGGGPATALELHRNAFGFGA